MSRWKAAGIHLGISVLVAALVGSVIYFVWYPPPYFRVSGGSALLLLIMGVDVVIGPFLTLTVFRSGKTGLKFDLTVIALLQAAAFCYGLSIIAAARPVFIVAAIDRFVAVSANEIEDADLAKGRDVTFTVRSWSGPQLVGALAPNEESFELARSAASGRDIEKLPQYYVPYDEAAAGIMSHAQPLAVLAAKGPTEAALVERFLAQHRYTADAVAYVPLKGHAASFAMVLSTQSRKPIGALAIDPW